MFRTQFALNLHLETFKNCKIAAVVALALLLCCWLVTLFSVYDNILATNHFYRYSAQCDR